MHPLHRRFCTKQSHLHYKLLGARHGRFYSDAMFSYVKSTQGNMCGQVFTNDLSFAKLIGMHAELQDGDALLEFIQDIGIPSSLHTDDAKAETLGKWKRI